MHCFIISPVFNLSSTFASLYSMYQMSITITSKIPQISCVTGQRFVFPPKTYVEALISTVAAFGCGAFGR